MVISLLFLFVFTILVLTLLSESKYVYFLGVAITLVWLFLFVLRPIDYGEDAINYYKNYYLFYSENSFTYFTRDFLFKALGALGVSISQSWYFFTFYWGSITIVLTYFVLRNLTKESAGLFAIVLFTSPVFFENTSNILRTTLCSLFIVAVLTSRKERLFGYMVGMGIHLLQSLVVLVPYAVTRLLLRLSRSALIKLQILIVIYATLKVLGTQIDLIEEEVISNLFSYRNTVGLNYVESQLLSTTSFSVSMYFQFILYCGIPTFVAMYYEENRPDSNKYTLIIFLEAIYVLLYPQVTFLLRIIPFINLLALFSFVQIRKPIIRYYSIALSFLGSVLLFLNLR